MVEKTITMSYNDYKMMSIENEGYKQRYENLAKEKMVYLTVTDQGPRYSHHSHHQVSGQIVEKDELLKKMKEHLEAAEERMKEREAKYEKRIKNLKEYQTEFNIIQSKWWYKLFR
jgi:chromosome segregation ATPase